MNTAKIYLPKGSLSAYIDHYMMVDIDWNAETLLSDVWRLIPFGQISILFLYGDPHHYSLRNAEEEMRVTPRSFVVGQLRNPIWLKFQGHTRLTKVQFKPAGIQRIMAYQMDELTDLPCIALEDIWGKQANEVPESLHEAEDDLARVKILDKFFIGKLLPKSPQEAYVEHTLSQLYQSTGNYRLADLEQQLGITGRQLERIFRAKVGLSPKEIGRFIRLNTAFSRLNKDPDLSLSKLAYELGYFDPAHFSKDFTSLTGLSPSRLKKKSTAEFYVTHGKCFANL
ncbi:AraC family transcriptional regulator [Desertivirga arenae]|uniref:AraC family transcriptional regulator n=1 Tax=Desertivirga arenae TaxID=2810309 RepID=UPI001A964D1E